MATRFEQQGDVGSIVLDAPPLNLFDEQLMGALEEALAEARDAPIRALMLRAEGRVFTAGVDVHAFQVDAAAGREVIAACQRLQTAVEDLEVPTLAVVHALCLTAGFELALACDMAWAAEDVQFGLVEAVVGITPLMGGTQRIAERAGTARAAELVMTAGMYSAEKLADWGVINRVLPADELLEKAERFAARLAAGPTQAHLATKRVLRAYSQGGVAGATAAVPDLTVGLFETEDLATGAASLLEHGPGHASFAGR